MPKLEYPAFFDGGLVGVRAKGTIQHREAFLFVPQKIIITVEKCLQTEALKEVYKEDVFSKAQQDWE
jgi:hypothetical protein